MTRSTGSLRMVTNIGLFPAGIWTFLNLLEMWPCELKEFFLQELNHESERPGERVDEEPLVSSQSFLWKLEPEHFGMCMKPRTLVSTESIEAGSPLNNVPPPIAGRGGRVPIVVESSCAADSHTRTTEMTGFKLEGNSICFCAEP
eukprot:2206951-Rhodomonas_salina.1